MFTEEKWENRTYYALIAKDPEGYRITCPAFPELDTHVDAPRNVDGSLWPSSTGDGINAIERACKAREREGLPFPEELPFPEGIPAEVEVVPVHISIAQPAGD